MSNGRQRTYPEKKEKTVGWDGISAQVPADWFLGAVTQEEDGGYLRWDDDYMPRLEVKWSKGKGFVDLESVIDRYLKEMQEHRQDDDPEVEVDHDVRLLSRREQKKAGWKCFQWSADDVGYGAAWTCKDCGRTTLAQVRIPGDRHSKQAREFAVSVLSGLSDHPEDDWILWAAHGLSCRVPQEFEIADQEMMTGLLKFEFERETESIMVARWGMANVALKDQSLTEWLGEEMGSELKKHDTEPEDAEIKGHEGLNIHGSSVSPVQALKRLVNRYMGRDFADQFIARAWHCQPANDIYYVQTLVDRKHSNIADDIVERIECHKDEDDDDAGSDGRQGEDD